MSRKLRATIGVLLSLALLGWALRDVSFAEVLQRIRDADIPLLTLSILITLVGFHFRAIRWGILLTPVHANIRFSPRLAATYIGFAANNVLPARVGEFARAFSLARLTPVGPASAFATLVIERLLDGLVLLALLFGAMAMPAFPADVQVGGIDVQRAALSLTILIGIGVALLVAAVLSRRQAARLVHLATRGLPRRLHQPLTDAIRSFAAGLEVLRSPRLFLISSVLALAQWLFLALSYFVGFRAFQIDSVPLAGAVFLQSFISLAVAIPSSPGFFGPFEAAARIGLGVWNVPADLAISFAIGYHIAGFIPVTLIGMYYVWRMNLTWSDLRGSEQTVEEELHTPDGPPPAAEGSPS